MIKALFLIAALSLPSPHHTWPRIVPYQAVSEEEQLRNWIKKKGDVEEVFIHPDPQEDVLSRHGWERFPATWNGNKIWIKRKPVSDQKKLSASA